MFIGKETAVFPHSKAAIPVCALKTQLAFHHILTAAGAFSDTFPLVKEGSISLYRPITGYQIGGHALNAGEEIICCALAVFYFL